MALVYFHCSNIEEGAGGKRPSHAAGNLTQIREQAILAVRALIAAPNMEDWRGWVLHVSDESGEEIFNLPFASLLGKAH